MYLLPFIRINRAVIATIIYPDSPILAISASEVISTGVPLLNPKTQPLIIATIIAILYNPSFASFYISKNIEVNTIYNKIELSTQILFIISYLIFNI